MNCQSKTKTKLRFYYRYLSDTYSREATAYSKYTYTSESYGKS